MTFGFAMSAAARSAEPRCRPGPRPLAALAALAARFPGGLPVFREDHPAERSRA
jgi:hypothetical protein